MNGSGPLETGTEFTSVGSIPMARSRWENSNVVVEARRPEVLEFHTEAVAVWRSGSGAEAVYQHRYEIVPRRDGVARHLPAVPPDGDREPAGCACR